MPQHYIHSHSRAWERVFDIGTNIAPCQFMLAKVSARITCSFASELNNMKYRVGALTICGVLFGSGCTQPLSLSDEEMAKRSDAGRQAATQLGKTLKSELMGAMQSGGPMAAVEVCNSRAPAIAAEISEQHGFEIYRTSLKPRQTVGDDWENKVMAEFDKRLAGGESVKQLEFAEVVKVDGKPTFRYMKAIPVGPPCLVCHGEPVADPIAAKIEGLYPNDQAVGYQLGQLRGAFSVLQVIE